MRVVLRRRPPAAAVSRWTTTGPATDFYILACVTNILRPLMEFAQRAVTKSAGAPGEAVAAEPDEYACDFSWHEVASKRLLRTLNMLRDVDCTLFLTPQYTFGEVDLHAQGPLLRNRRCIL